MTTETKKKQGVTVRAFVIGIILSALVAWATVMIDSRGKEEYPSANLIPALPYVALVAAGLFLNPLLRRIKLVRALNISELLLIFVMTGVSCGLASWGLCGHLLARVAGLSNRAWNTGQSQWDAYAMPFIHEDYYISAEGSQAAAMELYRAEREYEDARALYRAARELLSGQEELARVEKEVEASASIVDPVERAAEEKGLAWPHAQAERLLEMVTENWGTLGEGYDPKTVSDTYEPKIAELKVRRDALRSELKELNKESFDEVDKIRKGLPEGQRALPGFLPAQGEGVASWRARIQRSKVGSRILANIETADTILAQHVASGSPLPPDWPETIESAAAALEEIAHIRSLEEKGEEWSSELESLEASIAEQKAEQRRLRHVRRYAEQDRFEFYDEKVTDLEERTDHMEKRAKDLGDRIDKQVKPQLAVCGRVAETQEALRQIAEDARTVEADGFAELRERVLAQKAAFGDFDASHRRFWLGDANWGIWVKPLAHWLLVAFIVYMMFMSFNTLIYRQWAHNEKLIYPIAEVTTLLAGSGDESAGTPSLYRNGLFWFGVAISAGILGWNHLASNAIIPNVSPVKLEFLWLHFTGGLTRGLGSTYFCIIFAVIGLTFLVPCGISHSLWFFEVMYLGLLLVMSWMGYGNNRWEMGNPARNELGMGAALVFGVVVLWTCRKYLLCAFRPSGLKGLPDDEHKELRVSSWLFVASSLALILMLIFRFGANPIYTVLYYLVALVATIALMRAIAEGGVLSVEGALGLGMVGLVFGSDKGWNSPAMFVPFAIIGTLIYGGSKAFIASAMANAFKIRDSMSVRRPVFHLAIWAGILTTVVVASIATIILFYDRGANSMDGWMHTYNAKAAINGVSGSMASAGGAVNPIRRNWFFVGIVLMAALLLARQKVFGLPHPLGMVMLMNPVMYGFWGSILIGWLCKSLVSKYCSKEQYGLIRGFFVGLVVGHLVAVIFGWAHMSWHWG